jgi:hypothetical protein
MLKINTSDYAIGACINQLGKNKKLYPITFHLRKMILTEINYDIHDKKLLAIITTLQK